MSGAGWLHAALDLRHAHQAKLLNPQTPYDPVADFAAITQYAVPEVVMLVRSDSPYRTLKELADGYKTSRQPMRYGHFGNGSSLHFYGLVVGRNADIEVVPVACKGDGPAPERPAGRPSGR